MQDDFREAAELLGIADPSLVEKDYYILKVLEVVLPIESDIFHIAFAGGTSLSRAYGAIKRMSEDADIKLVWKNPEQQISGNQISKECKRIRLAAIEALAEIGLPIPDDKEHRIILDGRKLVHLHIPYETQLPPASSAVWRSAISWPVSGNYIRTRKSTPRRRGFSPWRPVPSRKNGWRW